MEEGTDRYRCGRYIPDEGRVWIVPQGGRWLNVHRELHLPREQSKPRLLAGARLKGRLGLLLREH